MYVCHEEYWTRINNMQTVVSSGYDLNWLIEYSVSLHQTLFLEKTWHNRSDQVSSVAKLNSMNSNFSPAQNLTNVKARHV